MSDAKIRIWLTGLIATILMLIILTAYVGNKLALWCRYPENSNNAEYSQDTYNQAHGDYIQPESCASIPGILDILAGNVDQRSPNSESENAEYSQGEQDLRAQRIMARWTFAIFVATAFSVIVMIIGTILVFATLMESRELTVEAARTTQATWEDVAASLRSVLVSMDANQQNLKSFRHDQRAWIQPESAEIVSPLEWSGGQPRISISVKLKNFGKSPAFRVRVFASLDIDIVLFPIPLPNDRNMLLDASLGVGKTIFPGDAVTEITLAWDKNKTIESFIKGASHHASCEVPAPLIIIGKVRYDTFFEDTKGECDFFYRIERIDEKRIYVSGGDLLVSEIRLSANVLLSRPDVK